MGIAGGFSDIKPADEDVQALFGTPEVLAAVAAALGKPVASLTVESYRTQVVAGLNYRVLCRTDGGEAVVATAFKPLPHTGAPLEVKGAVAGGEL